MKLKIMNMKRSGVKTTSTRLVNKVIHDNELRDLFDTCAIAIQNKIKKRRILNLRRSYYTVDKIQLAINSSNGSMLDTDKINLMHILLSNENVLVLIRKLMFEGYKITKELDEKDISMIEKVNIQFQSRNHIFLLQLKQKYQFRYFRFSCFYTFIIER